MAYCTQAQLEDEVGGSARLVALCDRDADGNIDTNAVSIAIAEADRWIDSYTSKRYGIPLGATHAAGAVQQVSARIAARALRRKRGMVLASDVAESERDDGWLKAVAKGEILLGVEPAPDPGEIVTDKAEVRDSTKAVSRERLKGFW